MVHTETFKREARLQLFLAASATSASNPLGDLGMAFNLGASIATRLDVNTVADADSELLETHGVNVRELHAVAVHMVSKFAAIPEEGEILPVNYHDVVVLNSSKGYFGLLQRLFSRLSVQSLSDGAQKLTIVRSPRTAWPEEVAWRPFYVSGDAVVCWDIRSLHQMISWGFPWMVKPFLSTRAFGGLSNAWNAALEKVVEHIVSADMPSFSRPKHLPALQEANGRKVADWIALSGTDGLVVEFKNAAAPPSSFTDPTPDYFEQWARGLFFSPKGLEQAYVTVLRTQAATRQSLAYKVGQAQRIWPIVVSPISVPQSPLFLEFIDKEANELLARLPPLPASTQPPTLMSIEEFFAFATLPSGTHGSALAEFREGAKTRMMWTFTRYLYERSGSVPRNEQLFETGRQSMEDQARCLQAVMDRLGADPE